MHDETKSAMITLIRSGDRGCFLVVILALNETQGLIRFVAPDGLTFWWQTAACFN
ncbi:hypothetical protein [Lacticaseibacillus zeae]|uniref:hypothetical protein n=1 Tax=Lacticaseibacillus zeae TaxID=57037 RepID=UPI0002FDE56A|nr:hypothetical protein [Lacticaseibacillus zeae]MDE3314813.1 hypothetical protein [Lacticaseibacillus zeae]